MEGEIGSAVECNCSHCHPKGYLLWFVPRDQLHLRTQEADMSTYRFNKHMIAHHFCPICGVAPFADGRQGEQPMAAVNVRCLEGVDIAGLGVRQVDGRSL